jgi:hypothetical protein
MGLNNVMETFAPLFVDLQGTNSMIRILRGCKFVIIALSNIVGGWESKPMLGCVGQ